MVVNLIIYAVSGVYIFFAVLMLFAYRRIRHYGLFVMGFTYGVSAGLALTLMHWWPLLTGFVLVWVLKLVGMDPDTDLLGRPGDTQRDQPG
jgi:hypothetical protein